MQHSGIWTTDDGTEIWYALDGSGPTVVLCDGLGCDGYVWRYIMDHLHGRFNLLRWHYRGHGNSSVPKNLTTDLTIGHLVEDLHGLLYHLQSREPLRRAQLPSLPVILVGHSMGCQVILEYARRYPEDTSALVLLNGSYGRVLDTFRGTSLFKNATAPLLAALGFAPTQFNAFWRSFMNSDLGWHVASRSGELNTDRVRRRDFKPYLRHMGRIKPETFIRCLKSAAEHTVLDALPFITTPALVVAGARDNFTPVHLSEEMARLLPESELIVLEEGTHTAPLEMPEVLNDALETFLRQQHLWTSDH